MLYIICAVTAVVYSAAGFGGVYMLYGGYNGTFFAGYIFGIAVIIMNAVMAQGINALKMPDKKRFLGLPVFKTSALCGIVILLFGIACMYVKSIPFTAAVIIEIVLAVINISVLFAGILHSDK